MDINVNQIHSPSPDSLDSENSKETVTAFPVNESPIFVDQNGDVIDPDNDIVYGINNMTVDDIVTLNPALLDATSEEGIANEQTTEGANKFIQTQVNKVLRFARNANAPNLTLAILKSIYSVNSIRPFLFKVKEFVQSEKVKEGQQTIPENWNFPAALSNIGGISQKNALAFLEQSGLWDAYIVFMNFGHLRSGEGLSRKVKKDILQWVHTGTVTQPNNNRRSGRKGPNKFKSFTPSENQEMNHVDINHLIPKLQPIKIGDELSETGSAITSIESRHPNSDRMLTFTQDYQLASTYPAEDFNFYLQYADRFTPPEFCTEMYTPSDQFHSTHQQGDNGNRKRQGRSKRKNQFSQPEAYAQRNFQQNTCGPQNVNYPYHS